MLKERCAVMLVFVLLAIAGCAEGRGEALPSTSLSTPTPGVTLVPSPTAPEVPAVGVSSEGIADKLSLEDLVARADYVLIGGIRDIKSEWNSDRTNIYTYVKVSVESSLKGSVDRSEVTIRVLGGRVGDVAVAVSAAPEFEVGERALLFLKCEEPCCLGVVGGFQGKYTIQGDRVLGMGVPLSDLVGEIEGILKH